MQILNLNVKYWQCHQHPQTHQYDMMLLNLQNADCSPPHGLTSTIAACRVDQHLSKYFINSDPSIDGDNSIHQEWRSHRHFLGTSTETNLPPGDHYADDDDHHVYGDFYYGVDDQIEIPVDPVIRETFLKYEHSSLTIFPIYVIS